MPTAPPAFRPPDGGYAQGAAGQLSRADVALFADRDLSLLRFQQRVLEEAQDERTPLLDRVRFLAIVGTNIDDFIMVRLPKLRADPARRLVVEAVAKRILRDAQLYWRRRITPALQAAGIHVVDYTALTPEQRAEVDQQFFQFDLPQLPRIPWTPRAPFPAVPSLGFNLLVQARTPAGDERLTIMRLPDTVSPLLRCRWTSRPFDLATTSAQERGYVWLDQVLLGNLAAIFPGVEIQSAYAFRLYRETDSSAEALATIHPLGNPLDEALAIVRRRDSNPLVALAVDRGMPLALLERLMDGLHIPEGSVHRVKRVAGLRRKWEVSRIGREDLHHPELVPRMPPRLLQRTDVFAALREGDLLLHHPFESFQPVVDLIRQAATDADVLGISMTIYRTDRESPIAHALLEAAQHGKHVRVVIELAARFDEERNVSWARRLADAGAHVSYAPAGLKVHTKMALVVRHEGARLRRYAHLSSGNYNAFTAKIYTDVGFLTCDDDITADVAQLFDVLTGTAGQAQFRKLIVAPVALRNAFQALVEREIEWSRRGEPGHIILKMNGLSDRGVIPLLYRASQAGVRVDLLVRGICCLRPGIAGVSENIHVRSVLGRFLEHSRIWSFRNGGDEEVYVGSADLMPRNLNRRIEVMVPLAAEDMKHRVRHEILGSYLADNTQTRELRTDGTYERVTPRAGEAAVNAQATLLHSQSGAA